MKFKPLNGAVVVKELAAKQEGIIIKPDTATNDKAIAEVLAVDETQEKWVEVGQKVLCDIRTTEAIPIEGSKYGILHKSQCYGIVE